MAMQKGEPTSTTRGSKPYSEPEIQTLGTLKEDTNGPSGGNIDGLFGGNGGFASS